MPHMNDPLSMFAIKLKKTLCQARIKGNFIIRHKIISLHKQADLSHNVTTFAMKDRHETATSALTPEVVSSTTAAAATKWDPISNVGVARHLSTVEHRAS